MLAPPDAADSALHPRGLEMRRVSTSSDWHDVRSIRYHALAARDDIEAAEDPAFGDEHDGAFNAVTMLLLRNGKPVASTRSSVSSASRRWELPAADVFQEEIEAAIGFDATIVEMSLTVVDPECGIDPKVALFHLLKAQVLRCAA